MRQKISVGILGATGAIGQKLIELLQDHPWFTITALVGSERSASKLYHQAVNWRMATPLPKEVGGITISPPNPDLPCTILFSALDASVAGEIEAAYAKNGYHVISKARNHRMTTEVPLIVPEVNGNSIKGNLITCPNCVAGPLSLALKPISDHFGIAACHVVTMQAISGAGFPGVPSLEILGNVIPHISGEVEKIQTEPAKILEKQFPITAQVNRVPVTDGHMISVSLQLEKSASTNELISLWENFQGLELPTAPRKPIHYKNETTFPQPKLHCNTENGMAISIGQLQQSTPDRFSFVILSHNTIRGGAGELILTAELLTKQGLLGNPHHQMAEANCG